MAKRKEASVTALFIGNSFTARNNLPDLVARLAAAQGKNLKYRLINVGGASLRTHWNGSEAQRAIIEGKYDIVVLQEQSTLPIKNARRMHENVRLFDEAIKSAGSKTVLYMTWARQHAPESQQAITDAYVAIGRELGALVVPVGVAWQTFLRKHKAPVLHDRDQSHPSFAGSYLAACVFVSTLFGKSPVGIDDQTPGLEAKDRLLLQKTAWQIGQTGAGKIKLARKPH